MYKIQCHTVFILCSICISLFSCAPLPQKTIFEEKKIFVGLGPEDMVADTFMNRNRLIISCAERRKKTERHGELWGLDLANDSAYILTRTSEPENLYFNPHGIDILHRINKTFITVVNHDNRGPIKKQSILVYQWNKDHLYWLYEMYYDGEYLIYKHRYPIREGAVNEIKLDTLSRDKSPAFTTANDVTMGPDGKLIWSNDLSKNGKTSEIIFKSKSGWVGSFQSPSELKKSTKMSYPNGVITVDNDLWVSTTRENKIFKIKEGNLDSDPIEIAKIKGGDNFSLAGDEVLVTAHLQPMKFVSHAKNSEKISPSAVYAIHKNTGNVRLVYFDSGKEISAASTAIQIGSYLYISQVFNPFLLKVKNK